MHDQFRLSGAGGESSRLSGADDTTWQQMAEKLQGFNVLSYLRRMIPVCSVKGATKQQSYYFSARRGTNLLWR